MGDERLVVSISSPDKTISDSVGLRDDANDRDVAQALCFVLRAWTWGDTGDAVQILAYAMCELNDMDGNEAMRPLAQQAAEWITHGKKWSTPNV